VKHLKSKSSDLRRLFQRSITVREITEPLVSFDADRDSASILSFLEARNFDVAGVRDAGQVIGFVRREDLRSSPTQSCIQPFSPPDVLAESDSLLEAMDGLTRRRELFVSVLGQVGGIITKGDLQKTPVRLWLFGIVSLVEMQLLRYIRMQFPDSSWAEKLTPARVQQAQKTFDERRRRNEETSALDFADCLQFCDKAAIFTKELECAKGFESRQAAQRFFSRVEALRNDLAHSNDILSGRWPELAELVQQCEKLLLHLEAEGETE
jgi:CBS domain-containing protein